MKILITVLSLFLLSSCYANAKDTFKTFTVTIEANVDGDTVRIKGPAYWPSFVRSILVRIDGVDTPEKGGRASCSKEANFASVASKMVAEEYSPGTKVLLKLRYQNGKYVQDKFWRILGDVKRIAPKSEWLSDFLISRDLAYEYHGGTKRNIWC